MISPKVIELIEKYIGDRFDSFGLDFLGLIPNFTKSKKIVFTAARSSLTSLFLQGLGTRNPSQQEETALKTMLRVSDLYLKGVKENTQARAINSVTSYVNDSQKQNKTITISAIKDIVRGELKHATNKVKMIVNAESQKVANSGTALQIAKIAESKGEEDPTIFFVVTHDDVTGPYEYILHTLPDKRTPRVWKLSEVISDYYKPGGQYPSLCGLHVNCRCKITYLAKGFGFKNGKISFIGLKHDELKSQREEYGLPSVPEKVSRKKS